MFIFSTNFKLQTLFIINGESNAGGKGLNSDALSAEVAVQTGVKILNLNTLTSFDNITFGTNNLLDHDGLSASYTTCHGFELELANRVRGGIKSYYFNPCYLVKTGQGGAKAADWTIGNADLYWSRLLARVNAAKSLINTQNYKVVVLLSMGINDGIAGTNVTLWKTQMTDHITNLRNLLGSNAVIVATQFQGMGTGGTQYAAYDAALIELSLSIPKFYYVSASGAGLTDSNHWNYAGLKLVAGRMLDVVETR